MEKAEASRFVIRGDGDAKLQGEEILFLSNMDQIMPKVHTRLTYFFSQSSEDENFMSTQVLLDSLSKVLTVFWPVAGKFKDRSRGGGWVDIERCEEGVEFWEVKFKGSFAEELGDHQPKQALTSLLPNQLPGTTSPMSKTPLLKVQLSRFLCGTVCLAVAIHHLVCDGKGVVDFVRAWAEISSGKGVQSLPHLDRSVMRARNPPEPSFPHVEYSTQPPKFPSSFPPVTAKLFKFTAAQVKILKEEANRNHQGQPFTGFDALAGHVWKCVTLARRIDPLKEVKLGFAIDGRERFVPPLPSNYFGNVNFYGLAKSIAGALVSQSLAHAASCVHEAKERVKDEYLRSGVDWVELQPSPLCVNPSFDSFCGSDVAMTSWSRFPSYETDFGWGKPTFFGIPAGGWDGLIIILPSPQGPPLCQYLGRSHRATHDEPP